MPYVSVRALSTDGKAMVFVELSTTVAELKAKIQESMQVPARSQTLVYRGRGLKNAQTIEQCSLDDSTSIVLFDNRTDRESVCARESTSSNLGIAGYAMGLLVNDNVETLMGLCADNVIVYHNPSSEAAPMYGRYYGHEGFIIWLKSMEDEFAAVGTPNLFNFSASSNYVFCEMELTVKVKKTGKVTTLSRIMKFMFNSQGKFVVWDVMEDSAPLAKAYEPKVFKAPDGTPFPSRRQVFQYWFNITDQTNETVVRHPGEINGQPFDVAGCKGCTIILADYANQVRLDDLEDCRILVGASSESVWMRNCKDCKITVACKEFRTFDSTNCEAHVLSMAAPVVERSSGIAIYPFNGKYELLKRHLAAAQLDVYHNKYNKVEDNSADDAELPKPHFTVARIPKEQWDIQSEHEIKEMRLAASTRVEGRFQGGQIWYPGTICTSNEDGTYKILYDDGDIEDNAAVQFVRAI